MPKEDGGWESSTESSAGISRWWNSGCYLGDSFLHFSGQLLPGSVLWLYGLSREIIPIKLSVISSTVNLWSLFTFACFVLCGGRMSLNCA